MTTVHLLGQLLGKLEVQKKASTTKRMLLTAGTATPSQINQDSAQGEPSTSSPPSSRQRSKISETVKEKLNLGAKMLRIGGLGKVFRQVFSVNESEKLLKASQCNLSTTAGPISGFLFITTEKIAFCSDRSVIKIPSPTTGEMLRCRYKVSIPLRKIQRANKSRNMTRASEKYLQVVTTDEFEFWFMGFVNYKRMFKCLHRAISEA